MSKIRTALQFYYKNIYYLLDLNGAGFWDFMIIVWVVMVI